MFLLTRQILGSVVGRFSRKEKEMRWTNRFGGGECPPFASAFSVLPLRLPNILPESFFDSKRVVVGVVVHNYSFPRTLRRQSAMSRTVLRPGSDIIIITMMVLFRPCHSLFSSSRRRLHHRHLPCKLFSSFPVVLHVDAAPVIFAVNFFRVSLLLLSNNCPPFSI